MINIYRLIKLYHLDYTFAKQTHTKKMKYIFTKTIYIVKTMIKNHSTP